MPRTYKKHNSAFRSKIALEAIKEKKTVAEICQEYGVAASQVFEWKKQLETQSQQIFEKKDSKNHKDEIDRLHRVIGQLTAERDFLERVFKH